MLAVVQHSRLEAPERVVREGLHPLPYPPAEVQVIQQICPESAGLLCPSPAQQERVQAQHSFVPQFLQEQPRNASQRVALTSQGLFQS